MPLAAGTRLGPYEILVPIGTGGMGEVYRAHDPRMGRDVAVKICAECFTDRFSREVRAVAALNHPNICQLYDVGPNYLVMELVEGPTLAERIKQGPVPLEEALAIAKQIAEAVEAAHENGIVHRDLKPGNIKLRPDGAVKVLDFGLAKVTESRAGPLPEDSPTLTLEAATRAGTIFGTAPYMSPEQARGEPVDKRADIWAYGVVLYEMLTGRRLFVGQTAPETLAAVLTKEPDWRGVPNRFQPLLKRCLQKDSRKRLRDIGDAMAWLESPPQVAAAEPARRAGWLWSSAIAVATLLTLLIFVRFHERPEPVEDWRFQISLPENLRLSPYGSFAVSPDGRQLAFFAAGSDGVSRLWVRSQDSLEVRPLLGTDAVVSRSTGAPRPPFWSPDSRFIAFGFKGKLMKADVIGGVPQALCDIPDAAVGGSWNRSDVLIFGNNRGGLMRVSASGGLPSVVTAPDPSRKEGNHLFPVFLPDGRHFVYFRSSMIRENSGIFVGSLDAKPEEQPIKRLMASDSGAIFVPSPNSSVGELLFLRESMLLAQRFDASRLELVGEPIRVAEQVGSFASFGFFSVSTNGVLIYRVTNQNSQLTWFDRQGKILGVVGEPGLYQSPISQSPVSLSPDGMRAAVSRLSDDGTDIWLFEFGRAVSTRLTFGPKMNVFPIWSPDGSRIVYASNRSGHLDLYQRASNGTGNDEQLLKSDRNKFPTSWSPDGHFLLYTEGDFPQQDLWLLPLDHTPGDRKPIPFLQSPFYKDKGKISNSNRWIAYVSGESGRSEVYVQTLDSAAPAGIPSEPGKWIVSNGGGASPHWRGDGRELFYLAPDGKVMAVEVNRNGAFQAPQPLFQGPPNAPVRSGNDSTPSWDVTADGKRFLFLVPQLDNSRVPFTVQLNWKTRLKK